MKDRLQGISHDRILMRVKDYLQIIMTVGGVAWFGIQAVRQFDRMNYNISILQQQMSAVQQAIANLSRKSK